jgi:putative ABC transport system permease protein
VDAEVVSHAYFDALRVVPARGRTFGPEEDTAATAQPVTIIGARLWTRRFAADPAAIGRTLRVNDVPLTIVGVLPETFAGLNGKTDVWISPPMAARFQYDGYLTTRQNFIGALGRLRPGVTFEQANAEVAAVGSRLPGQESESDAIWSATAVPLDEARIDPSARRSALVLLGAAACVLVTACVNVASLLLARARLRRREIAVRLAIGASRARLVRQLLAEGFALAAIAGALGTLFAAWGVKAIAAALPAVIPTGRNIFSASNAFSRPALDPGVLLFAIATTAATILAFALVPALQSSRPQLATALKEDDRGGAQHGRALSVLVVTEVAFASVLLAGSGLLIESFARIQSRRGGFSTGDVVTFWVRPPAPRYAYPADGPAILERLLTRIQSMPGVESAALNRCTPFTGCARSVIFFADRPVTAASAPGIGRHYVSADYFRTLGIPLLAGRALTPADRTGTPPVAIANETAAKRFWPGESAIGKRVWFGATTGPFADPAHAVDIVGVVGDVKYESVEEVGPRADFYTSYLQFSYPDSMFVVKTRGPAAPLVPALRKAVASVDDTLPIYDVMTLDERIGAAVARPRFNAAIVTAFAAAALLLAAIGIYGVLSFSVSARMREIGVRLALGADAARVIRLVVGRGLRLVALGTGAGLIAAVAAGRLLQGLIVDVATTDARILAGVAATMIAVAAVAAFLPARRASTVDPVVVLRAE